MQSRSIIALLVLFCFFVGSQAQASSEKPVQHLKLEDVSDATTAKAVFIKDTETLRGKENLDGKALQEIHMITYSLEKSVAYYAENGAKDVKTQAKIIADVVEALHLSSENNRKEASEEHLMRYLQLADKFLLSI